ncbi:MAG: MATE family efflux transporter [Lachnospiraceae bacterium]|nr:MATE family efflux transporter [Lachnospiraceae bacterium]
MIQISFIIITIIANQQGLNDAAAVGIVEKIMSFLFLIPSSMLSTVSALGAQNIGAKKPKRAVQTLKYAIILTVSIELVVSILMQFGAENVVALFPSTLYPMGLATAAGSLLSVGICIVMFVILQHKRKKFLDISLLKGYK